MKLHLPTALRKALLACLAAFTLPVSVPITVGSSFWIISGERAQAVSWDLVVDEDFNGSFDKDVWKRIQYETTAQTNAEWRKNQSTDEELVEFREVEGDSNRSMTLWGKYGDTYTNQNNQNGGTGLYACGGVYTKDLFTFQYGYVEVRARFDTVTGCWPAIWMLPKNGAGWPRNGEIDIMEHLNSDNLVYQTLHWTSGGAGDTPSHVSPNPGLGGTPSGWHTYGLEWTEGGITFYVDGKATGTLSSSSEYWPFNKEGNEFYLLIDQQIGGNWVQSGGKQIDNGTLGSTGAAFDIDYVKVYSASEKNRLEKRTWQASTGTWKEGSEDAWEGGTFASGQEAVFGEAGAGTVQVDGTVHAGNMIVQAGGYTFSAKEGSAGSIEVVGTLDMREDATFSSGLKLGGNPGCSLKGSGAVNYAGAGTLTINRINPSEFTGQINITGSGRLLISTDFEAGAGASVNLGENAKLAFDNNNLDNGGAGADTVFSADVTGLSAVEAKGGFTVTLTGNVTGGGALTMGQYNGAGFLACLVFGGDVSGFTSFVTSAKQYNYTHGNISRAAYAFNAGLALGENTTFEVVKNDDDESHDSWIELGSTSRLTGNGTIVKKGEGDLRIEGDTSGYTGKIQLQAGGLVLNGTNGQNIDLSLENAEAVAQLKGTGGVLNSVGVGGDAASGNLQMEANSSWSLKIVNLATEKTLTISGAGICAIEELVGNGGLLTVEQGSTVKLGTYSSGEVTLNGGTLELSRAGSLTSLTLGAGARVETDLTDGTLNFGALSVSEVTRAAGDAVLSLTGMLDGLTLQASSVEGTLHIALSDEFITTQLIGTDGYALFADGSLWQDHVVFDNATYGSRLKISGNNLVFEALSGLYWAGTDGSHVWNAEASNTDWKNGDDSVAFTGSQDVVFMPGEGVSTTVELAGTLAPGNVTVGKGTGWVFSGSGNLNATGRITVGGEGGPAELTLSGTGTVHSEGLSLVGSGTKLTITSAPTSGAFDFKHMELGEGTELVLLGSVTGDAYWTRNQAASYASGAGSIVLAGAGVLNNGMASEGGILWAFFGNTDVEKERIGNLRLSKNGENKTTLALNGEQGRDNSDSDVGHGLGVVEHLWVDDGCSLVVRSRAMGITQGECTLHLIGDGSGAAYTQFTQQGVTSQAGTADAALVLGKNTSTDGMLEVRGNNIYWNVATVGNASISVLEEAGTWTLMKELNVGTYTLTKKGAGTLKLDASSTLVGSGKIVVSEGQLGLSGNMTGFTGSVQAGAEAGKTLTLEGANISAGSIAIDSNGAISLGAGTNFSAGSLTLSGSFSVTGGVTLAGDGVINVAEGGTLSLAAETYSGMHVGLQNGSGTSTLELTGGSFTGSVDSVNNRGTIKLTGATAGAISTTGDTMLRVGDGGSFSGTITLAGGSGQKLGVFGASGDDAAGYAITLNRVESTAGGGILVAGLTTGGLTVTQASGLSEVWVGGPAGTRVSIETLTAQGTNQSFTLDNGLFPERWPDGTGGENLWAGNSGQLTITGAVTGYTSFTAKRKGTAVTDGLDLIFQGEVAMGDGAEVTITATNSEHDNTVGTADDKYATILFDTTSSITGNGSIAKQGAGKLVLAGSIAEGSWSLNVQGGTVELGKSGQESALDYSLTGLSIVQGSVVESKSACHLTLTGALEAEQGTIKMSAADSSLALHGIENKLGTLELGASGATLRMEGSADGFAQLALGAFTPGGQTLTLELDGLDVWFDAHAGTNELQLFTGEGVADLVAAITDKEIEVGRFHCTLDDHGMLTIAVDTTNTWSDGGTTMEWAAGEHVWGGEHDSQFNPEEDVVFAGTSTAPITVTLGEAITLTKGMIVQRGEGVDAEQSYTFGMGENALSVGADLSIKKGITASFTGSGTISVTGQIRVGSEGGSAQLTLSGTGAVHSEGLSLAGEGTKLTITSAPSDGVFNFKHMELGEGAELVLQGSTAADFTHWTCNNSSSYASGAGSIVLEGAGVLSNGSGGSGILWAFFGNDDRGKERIGNLKLRASEGTGTTLALDAEMGNHNGSETKHGLGVLENLWVEDGSSLVVRSRALGVTEGECTLHLSGDGSNATYTKAEGEGGGTADAALVLGYNTVTNGDANARSSIYWNVAIEGNTSVSVQAATSGDAYTWTLMKELNVGEYTLTKKGAGTLKLDASSTLVGTGDIVVSDGALQVGANMGGYTGTIKVQGGSGLTLSATNPTVFGVELSGGATMTMQTGGTIGTLTVNGAGVSVADAQTLTVTTLNGGEGGLTSLSLGAGSTLDVTGGTMSLKGALSLSGDARLNWGGSNKITLGQGFSLSSDGGTLHIHLSDEFMGQFAGHNGEWDFFNYDDIVWNSSWASAFTLETDDTSTYEGLHIDEQGHLAWISQEQSGMHWAGTADNHVWSTNGENTDWKNGDSSVAFTNSDDVTFTPGNGVSREVTLDGTLAPGNVTVSQGTGWVFSGSGNLNATGKITVGGEGGSAELTLSGTGAVHSEGLTLSGNGTKLIITSAPSGNEKYIFKHMELGAGTELVLRGAAAANYQRWDLTNSGNNNYASGAGSIVLEGTGILRNGMSQAGILWAFFWNSESTHEGQTIGNMKLRSNGGDKTTLILDGEMGSGTGHGIGVVENLWVENDSSLVLRSRALGVTTQTRTLHLSGDGSNGTYTEASYEGEVTTDAALVLGRNRDEDHAGSIYWNVTAEANTSISVLKDTGDGGRVYEWTLMKELNVGGFTLTKKGAGTLKLDASSTLVGSGTIIVSEGQLGLSGDMTGFTGSVQAGVEAGRTLTLGDANISAGSIAIGSDGTLSFGEGTNFSAGSLTLSGSFSVSGGATLAGDGVINVAKSGTLSLAAETYSGMHVELLDDSGTQLNSRTESTLVLTGGSFTGSVSSVNDRGTIKVTGETAGAISITGDTMLRVGDGGSFAGTITLAGESGQKLGVFGTDGDSAAGYAIALHRVESTTGEGILVAGKTTGGVTVAEASGLSEVWVGGPSGTNVSIGTLTAQGTNHSLTLDNGVFPTRWPNPTEGDDEPWAGNSGKLIITGAVTGYTSFTAKKKGTAVTDGLDLIFQGEVSMGDGAEVTINATNTEHDGTAGTDDDKYATILFDATSSITGSGSIAKQGAGKLVLAGSIAAGSWSLNVQGGTVELGKSGQENALNYSLTGLSIAQGSVVESKSACHLTLTGALEAEQGTIKMSAADSSLALHGSGNKLGTLELGASGVTLRMGGSADGFAQLALGAFTSGEQTLTLALDGLDEWIAAQAVADTYELTLFTGEGVADLVAAIGGNIEAEGFDCTLDSNGTLTISVDVSNLPLTWSGDGTTMTWTSQEGGNVWGDGHDTAFDSTKSVIFAGTSTEPITVTLGEDITLQRGMTVKKGAGVEGSQSYTFDLGNHNLSVGQNLKVEEGVSATFTGAGYVHSEGLSLSGEGTKLIIASAPSSGTFDFKRMELGEGTELVLRGATAADFSHWNCNQSSSYASGAGSIVLEGAGVLYNNTGGSGILWAFFGNTDIGKERIGNLRLSKNGEDKTTLALDGEQGNGNRNGAAHGIGVVENLWVDDGCSLVVRSRALGVTEGECTLYLTGDGSNASYGESNDHAAGGTADAALVLGDNRSTGGEADQMNNIYWNVATGGDTSISVLADANGSAYTWTLMKELNVGEYTLTKKGAGTLTLDAGGSLVGTGDIVVSGGALQVGAEMSGYSGTIRVQEGSGLTLSANNPTVSAVELSGGATMTMQTGGTIETLTVNGAGVSVADAQTLTVTTLNGGGDGLTSLSLGAGSTLAVADGTMSLKGALILSGDARLNWGGADKITLGQGFSLDANGATLHIHLSGAFMEQFAGHNGEMDFFNCDNIVWNSSWASAFTLETDDTSTYGELHIDNQGHLAWSSQEQSGMHWAGTADNHVWSTNGENTDWKNGGSSVAFTDTDDVIFMPGNGVSREVTLVGDLAPGNVTVSQGTGWVFSGEGNLNATGKITVGGEGGSAELTLSGTGAVHSAGLSLVADGTKLTIRTDDSGNNALYSFGHMELEEGTELVLQGANAANYNHWTRSASNYASGAGSIVLEGAGVLRNDVSQRGILWAFFWNREGTHEGQTIGNLILRSYEGTGTTLFIDGEMGIETDHAIGVVENFWVEDGSSLVIQCRVLGKTTGNHSNTLHLKGNGSNASDGGVDADAALVLGPNGAKDGTDTERSKIYWNIKAESDTSIDVWVASTTPECAEWTLMKELNVGGFTLTKKGAGTLKLDAGGALVGSGNIVVSDGALQVDANMSGYMGTIKVQGGSGLTLGADASTVNVSLENGTAEGNVLNLGGTGTLQSVSLGGSATGGKLQMGENSSWTLKSVNMGAKALTIGGTGVCAIEQLTGEGGSLTVEQGGTVKLGAFSALTSLTLGAGVRLETDLTNGTLGFGALSVASDAVLSLNGVLDGLKLSATSVEGSLLIELTEEFVSSLIGTGGYELFGNDSPLLDHVTVRVENAHYAERLRLQGNMVVIAPLEGLYWAGTDNSHVWDAEAGNTDWKNGEEAAAFTEAANVVFMPGSGVSKTVELVGDLAPGNVTVGQGTGWVFSGSGNLNATGKITVGGEGGLAELTLSGTGYVHSEGLSLVGSGTKLTITSAPTSGAFDFKHMELGTGTELVLQGSAAANYNKWTRNQSNNYASGAGSIVLEDTGIIQNNGQQAGILWAFFWNSSADEGRTIGNLKLRSTEGGASKTTLIINGEQGTATDHGIGVVENLWVENNSSLIIRCRVLGATAGNRTNTLHLSGNGSGDSYTYSGAEGSGTADAALVLGSNATTDGDANTRNSIYWNITAEVDTSISVLAAASGDAYTWTLMKELNVGEHTLTKKGAGTLKLDAGGTLVGTGDIVVSDGALQVDADMSGYTGTIKIQGGSGVTLSADASTVSVSLESGTAEENVLNLSGSGALKNVSLGENATNGTLSLAESANRTLSGMTLKEGQTLIIQGAGSGDTQSRVTIGSGDNVVLNGGTLQLDGINATVGSTLSGENSTVQLSSGTAMAMQADGVIGTLTVNGAGVSVAAAQTLTVTTLNGGGGGLTSLSLGAGSTLNVAGGTMSLKGALSLSGDANLNWGGTDKITLGQGFSLNADGGTLSIYLSDEFMGQFAGHNGELDFFKYDNISWDSSWASAFTLETDDVSTYGGLHIDEQGHLAWAERSGVQWDGTSGSTWSDGSTAGWEDAADPNQPAGEPPAGQDVYFVASSSGNKDVTISGEVTPANVFVEEGEFTFRSEDGGGINITENKGRGTLAVGGGTGEAKLTLATANTNLPSIELKNNGSLVLANDAALTVSTEDGGRAENTTKIKFRGGVLEYSGDQALTEADVSRFVANQQDGSNSAVKVKVDAEGAYSGGVTWGSAEATVADNGGVAHVLDDEKGGIEKSGSGSFTLEWQDAGEANHAGSMAVTGGTLEYKVHADGRVTMSGDANVSKPDPDADAVKLVLTVAEGSKGTLDYAGTLTGDGSVELQTYGGRLVMSGDSSAFEGIIDIAYGTVSVESNDALGGEGTTLVLSGGNLSSTTHAAVQAGTVEVEADARVSSVELTGKVVLNADATFSDASLTGQVTNDDVDVKMIAGNGATSRLSGDISGFSGKLDTGESGTWQLSGQALEGDVIGTVGGHGTVEFEGDAVFSGAVQDGVTLKSSGEGRLVVASLDTSEDAKLGGNVQLGSDNDMHAQWNGRTVAENSVITLANVSLAEGGLNRLGTGARVLVDTSVGASLGRSVGNPGVVDVNGMAGENLQGITVNSGGQLRNVSGTYAVSAEKKLSLCIENANISQSAEEGTALITGRDDFTLDLSGTEGLSVNWDNVAGEMLSLFTSQKDAQLYLHLLEGGKLAGTEGVSLDDVFADSILKPFITQMSFDDQGNLVLLGNAVDVYVVNKGEPLELEDPNVLNASKSTVLLDDLTLNYDGGTVGQDAILHNLLGTYGTTLYLQNSNPDAKLYPLTVTLDNTHVDDINPDEYHKEDGTTVQGQHTVFNGNIDGGEGVNIRKVGKGTLTVGGKYRLADGTTILEEGSLKLRGNENVLADLRFAYNTEQDTKGGEEERGLTLQGGRTTLNGSVREDGSVTDGNQIAVTSGAELVFTGEQEMQTTRITGDGSGSLTLAQGESQAASLKLAGKPGADGNPPTQLSGVAVNMGGSDTTLDIGQNAADVTKLSGEGVLRSDRGGSLAVEGGAFAGTLAASDGAEGAGTLVVKNGGSFTLSNVSSAGGATRATAWDVKLGDDSKLKVDVSRKSTSDPADKLVLGDVDLGNGCMTVDFGDKAVHENALEACITGCGANGILELHSDGEVENGEDVSTGISVSEGLADDFVNHVKFSGAGNFVKDREWKVEDGMLKVTTRDAKENKFERAMPNAGKNGLAGAQMMWESLKDKSQTDSFFEVMLNPSSDYAKLTYELVDLFDNQEAAALERTLTAVAGSSIATIGPAVMEDMHRQLKAIRNRTTTMSDGTSGELPASHIWINGETGYYKLSSDGYLPGYSLSNWGGTLGVDVDISDEATVGIALSAMYGDLRPSSADSATGNLDTTYLSAFLRANSGAWIHTFVVSGGIADINLDRTVHYGSGSYRTSGNTEGYSFGAIYELGYTLPMSPEGTMAIQPILNVEIRHASVKGYTEGGSDVALRVDGIKQDVVTFGLGARMQSAVGENAFNRRAIFEARALAKLDAGDRSGKSRNGIIGNSASAEVESAETGAAGFEIGAGLSVPIGSQYGSVFMDASFEWRDGWSSVDASVGYRINF